MVRIGPLGEFHEHTAVFCNDLSICHDLLRTRVGEVSDEQNIGKLARGNASQVMTHPERLCSIDSRHLDSNYRWGSFFDCTPNNMVHMAESQQSVRVHIICNKHDTPGINTCLCIALNRSLDVTPA